jgi:protein TonB
MFEDSTFESSGRIRTRSRGWMIAALIFNGSILLALILIPLIYPQALPRQQTVCLMELPAPPTPEPRPQPTAQATPTPSEIQGGQIFAPPRIPAYIAIVGKPEAPPSGEVPGWDTASALPNGPDSIFRSKPAPIVRAESRGPVRVSSSVVAGLLIQKTIPVYPPIAKAVRLEGTVILQATISKAGTIENLHVIDGPGLLQQAALDAVKTWRYRPYLLNGEPVEVETSVNVVFTVAR